MGDEKIIALFFSRSETALTLVREKYGKYCRHIAYNILGSNEDAEEAENSAFMKAWETIPPNNPDDLRAYLGMLCRSAAIDVRKRKKAYKRGGAEYDVVLDELGECIASDDGDPGDVVALRDALEKFFNSLQKRQRVIFMRRYYWSCSISEISASLGMREGAVKMTLSRLREKLKDYLKKEGFDV